MPALLRMRIYRQIWLRISITTCMARQSDDSDLYRNRADKNWSLTDCISFVVMKRKGITEALTGDHHFEQAGFKALL
jgi:predicted nucleic acid-binding protein